MRGERRHLSPQLLALLVGCGFCLQMLAQLKVSNGKLSSQRNIPLIFPLCFCLFPSLSPSLKTSLVVS